MQTRFETQIQYLSGSSDKLLPTEWSLVFEAAQRLDETTGRKLTLDYLLQSALVECKLWAKFVGDE